MISPEPQELRVATDALRTEADVWDEQSRSMEAIRTKAGDMSLNRVEAGIFQLIVGPYNDVVQQVATRAAEGAQAMRNVAVTLRHVAATYDAEDAAGEHQIRNLR